MAVFNPNEIAVFDRGGNPLGVLTGWTIEQPRSFRLNEIEDMTFSIPRRNMLTGEVLLTDTVVDTLLRRDNLVYLQNEQIDMRGWAGAIGKATFGDDRAIIPVYGILSLFHMLETLRIEQTGGLVWTIASRLVAAAQAKQAAHGDLVVKFQHDPPLVGTGRANLGEYSYEGDILAGLQQLANNTLTEFFVHSRVGPDGKLHATLRWAGGRYSIDKTDIVITDGPGGNIMPGNQVTYTTDTLANRVRLRGTPTDLGRFIDYQSIRDIVGDIVPEVEEVLDSTEDPHHRRREVLDLSVNFGYSTNAQKGLALQIQERYLGYYKAFLYAHHGRFGRPYLEGFNWAGPDGDNDRSLTTRYFRTWSRLAYIGKRTVLTGTSWTDDETVVDARFDDWVFDQIISIVGTTVGVATDWSNPINKFVGDGDTGIIWVTEPEDGYNTTEWLGVAAAGETLRGLSTDATSPGIIWVLLTTGSQAIVRSYSTTDKTLISQWAIAVPTANDISVQAAEGIVWLVASDGVGNVQKRDINSGASLGGYPSGFANPTGLHVTGGLIYVTDATGNIRFLFAEDGSFAGSKATGLPSGGLYVDTAGGKVWIIRAVDGNISLYNANIAVGSIEAPGAADGAPGFDAISAGQFVSIVLAGNTAVDPARRNRLVIVYSPGRYVTRTIETAPGEPNILQRQWVTGEQKVAMVKTTDVTYAHSDQVIQGEESRVDDWDPKVDGYAAFGDFALKTSRGKINRVRGWYFKDWDIPDSAFTPDPPDWPEGRQYLRELLIRMNRERGVQVLRVNNRGDLFKKLVLGGKYTVNVTLQGPPAGLAGVLRVLAYTPDENQGTAEIIGEWV